MFCGKCGSSIPDGLSVCGACGTPLPQDVASSSPVEVAQSPIDTQPVAETSAEYMDMMSAAAPPSPAELPVEPVPVADPEVELPRSAWPSRPDQPMGMPSVPMEAGYAPSMDGGVPMANMPMPPRPKQKKKWIKPTAIIAGIMAVVTTVWVLAGPYIVNSFRKMFMDPTEYYACVEYEALERYVDGAFSKLSVVDLTDVSINNTLSVEVTQEGKRRLETFGVDLDDYIDTEAKAEVKWTTSFVEGLIGADASVSLGDMELATVKMLVDVASGRLYGQLPGMDEYAYVDVFDGAENLLEDIDTDALMGIVGEDLHEEFVDLLKKYMEIALENCFEMKESDDTLTVEGVKSSYTLLEAEVTEADLSRMAIALLTELEKDESVETLIYDMVDAIGEISDEIDVDDLVDGLDELWDDIGQVIEYLEDQDGDDLLFTYKVWVDGKGDIVGREIATEDDRTVIGLYNAVDGGKQGTELLVKIGQDEVRFCGVAKRSGDTLSNGEYALEVEGEEVLIIELEEFDVGEFKDLNMDAKFKIRLSNSISNSRASGSQANTLLGFIESGALGFDIQYDDSEFNLGLTLYQWDDALLHMTYGMQIDSADGLSVPGDADEFDEDQVMDAAEAILEKLEEVLSSDLAKELARELPF